MAEFSFYPFVCRFRSRVSANSRELAGLSSPYLDIVEKMIRERAFNVAEMGLTYYLRTLDFDDPPFVALPIFQARAFRHASVLVNVHSGIEGADDLARKVIGEFGM